MAKERIYELAKELKMPSKDLVNMANRQGMGVKSHMSSVTPDQAQQLRQLAKGGQKTTNNQHQPVKKNDGLNKLFFDAIHRVMVQTGHMMKGGTIVDATIINAPSSTKNADKARDPEMHQTKKGNEWKFGMKCHIGVDAGSGLVHTITVTAANEHDITQAAALIREDDEVVYGDPAIWGFRSVPK